MKPILIVSCGSSKRDHTCRARNMYVGGLFITNRRYAEKFYEGRWFILSSKYGLIDPDQVIEPYEQRIKKGAKIKGLEKIKGRKVYFLGSREYCDAIPGAIMLLGEYLPGIRQKILNHAIDTGIKAHKIKNFKLPKKLSDKKVVQYIQKGWSINQIRKKGSCCSSRFKRLRNETKID